MRKLKAGDPVAADAWIEEIAIMPREFEPQGSDPIGQAHAEEALVPVMFAASTREAEKCIALLKENQISAELGDADEMPPRRGSGIPVLVPGARLDEASEILSARADDDDLGPGQLSRDEDEEEFDDDFDDDYDADEDDDFDADEDDDAWDDDDDEEEDEE